jgi:hypothetical protein
VTVNAPQTNYFAVVGPQTVWAEGHRSLNIQDDADQTILLIEAAGLNRRWAEPRDLTFDEAVGMLTGTAQIDTVHTYSSRPGFFYKHHDEGRKGVHIAFASGRVAFLPTPVSKELATALLTAHGGEDVHAELDEVMLPQLDWGKIYAFVAFVALALWPGVRMARG